MPLWQMLLLVHANDPDAAPARYDTKGNIFVANNEDIYIYS